MKIEVNNLCKSFKNDEVITDINLTFESGKIYGLYGRNGSGKSVFLKLLCGIYLPSSGNVLFDGVNYNELGDYPKDLRVLIEKPAFFPNMTGYDNLKILADIQNKIGESEIAFALDVVNLFEERDKQFCKYSLGMKQKLGIAQVIMENPSVMIFDEPFNGIEIDSVRKIINYLKEEKKKGKIIIVSTHIKDDLNELADEIIYFDNGKILEYDKNA